MAQDKNSIMLVVAGFFGSLIAVGKASHGNMRDNLLAISAGTSSAYFLTPVVFSLTGIEASQQTMSAMAFLLGVLGQRGVEIVIGKIFPEAKNAPVD
jgi:alpha/beta superfamily hydrolase